MVTKSRGESKVKRKKRTGRTSKPKNRLNRVNKYKDEVCFLSTCKPAQRRSYLKSAPPGVVHALGDIANTVLRGNLHISNANRTKLKRRQRLLESLSSPRSSLSTKKRLLSQKGGSFLGVLWNAIKSILS